MSNSVMDDLADNLRHLFSESVAAKIWSVAVQRLLDQDSPTHFPEYTSPGANQWVFSDQKSWTSGFFPGCVDLIRERLTWQRTRNIDCKPDPLQLEFASKWWRRTLWSAAAREDTHDVGFIVMPWARPIWESFEIEDDLHAMEEAAKSLASRFDSIVGCTRSWDKCVSQRHSYTDKNANFFVIIDNMMNLELLFYVAHKNKDQSLFDKAVSHALTTMRSHIRKDGSTCHVVDFDQGTGKIRSQLTHQGYSDTSCWARGQAWALAGFVQCFEWTEDKRFIDTAFRLADYFIERLAVLDWVCPWDFDAPGDDEPKDTSAACIAAYGMLLLFDFLNNFERHRTRQWPKTEYEEMNEDILQEYRRRSKKYYNASLQIMSSVIANSLNPEATFMVGNDGSLRVENEGMESILRHATINNHEFATKRIANTGLIYADYFFILFGNKLAEINNYNYSIEDLRK